MLKICLLDNGYKPKGAYDREPIFTGENYGYWKSCMCIHINSVDKGIWDVIINGTHEISMTNGEGIVVPKSENQWNENYKNLWSYDWKAQNILIYALGVDEF